MWSVHTWISHFKSTLLQATKLNCSRAPSSDTTAQSIIAIDSFRLYADALLPFPSALGLHAQSPCEWTNANRPSPVLMATMPPSFQKSTIILHAFQFFWLDIFLPTVSQLSHRILYATYECWLCIRLQSKCFVTDNFFNFHPGPDKWLLFTSTFVQKQGMLPSVTWLVYICLFWV